MSKPYSFGMEVEINDEERSFTQPSWMLDGGWESGVIREMVMVPCGGREFLRRITLLGRMFGFEYRAGEDDERAESFHLHIGKVQASPSVIHNPSSLSVDRHAYLSPLLIAANHLSRTGVTWRDAQQRHANMYIPFHKAPEDTKGYWATNNDVGTVEIRLNETPSPIIPTLLLPVVVQGGYIAEVGAVAHTASPTTQASAVKEALKSNGTFDSIIRDAKCYWNTPCTTKMLNMFVEGASMIDVWEYLDTYLIDTSKNYNNKLQVAGL